jgi:probable phosphomutase (TIGR03848 family)
MTKFLLIRHAATDTAGKKLTGRMAGVHLNERGMKQAQHLAERLANIPIAAIYSSPLERAIETAKPLAKGHHLQTIIQQDFIEIDFGEWTDCSFEELRSQKQFQLFNTFRSTTRIPGGESMMEAQTRMIAGLQQLCLQHPNETVAVVSHADTIKAAVTYYAGIPLDLFQRIEISPASVSIIEVYEETARIMLVNDVGGINV